MTMYTEVHTLAEASVFVDLLTSFGSSTSITCFIVGISLSRPSAQTSAAAMQDLDFLLLFFLCLLAPTACLLCFGVDTFVIFLAAWTFYSHLALPHFHLLQSAMNLFHVDVVARLVKNQKTIS